MPKKIEKEYNELRQEAEKAGIADLLKVIGDYNELVKMSSEYFQEMNQKYTSSTLDCSSC